MGGLKFFWGLVFAVWGLGFWFCVLLGFRIFYDLGI